MAHALARNTILDAVNGRTSARMRPSGRRLPRASLLLFECRLKAFAGHSGLDRLSGQCYARIRTLASAGSCNVLSLITSQACIVLQPYVRHWAWTGWMGASASACVFWQQAAAGCGLLAFDRPCHNCTQFESTYSTLSARQ